MIKFVAYLKNFAIDNFDCQCYNANKGTYMQKLILKLTNRNSKCSETQTKSYKQQNIDFANFILSASKHKTDKMFSSKLSKKGGN